MGLGDRSQSEGSQQNGPAEIRPLLRERLRLYFCRRPRAHGLRGRDTWIGIHGARLGAGYLTSFQGLCFIDLENGTAFEPRKAGCREFLDRWYEVTMASTNEAFDIMEANGVSPDLRKTNFEMPDDPQWPAEMNAIRKPDWPLRATDALNYNLVTKALAD